MYSVTSKFKPHKSHRMRKAGTTILTPCSTSRFYAVRKCARCGRKEYQCAAGHFIEPGLDKSCEGKSENPTTQH